MEPEYALAFAKQNERLAASLGQSVEEFAAGAEFSVSLEEAVQRGWITAEEQRLFEHRATREDLEALGCPADEVDKMLRDQ